MIERVERVAQALGLPPGGALQIIAAANTLMGIVSEPTTPLPQQLDVLEMKFTLSC